MTGWDGFLEREGWRDQTAENSARQAYAWGTARSTGAGALSYREIIDFGVLFVDKPMFSYGCELLSVEHLDDTGAVPPVSSGFVYRWERTARGFYSGAYVLVVVSADNDTELEHHFSFTGVAAKDIPVGGAD